MKSARISTQQWRLQLELTLARVRWFPVLVTLMSIAALLVAFALLPRLAKQEKILLAKQTSLRKTPKIDVVIPKDPLAAFNQVLSNAEAQTGFLRALSKQASQAGLKTGRIDFRLEHSVDAGFDRLSIVIPVTGRYPVVQGFAFGLLAEFRGLALDKIELRREQPNLEELDAQLHFSLLVEASQ